MFIELSFAEIWSFCRRNTAIAEVLIDGVKNIHKTKDWTNAVPWFTDLAKVQSILVQVGSHSPLLPPHPHYNTYYYTELKQKCMFSVLDPYVWKLPQT